MNQEKRNALISIGFYVLFIMVIIAINVSGKFKSGPCTPNLDFLSVFLLVILNVVLLLINGIRAFLLGKETRLSFVVHLAALLIGIVCVMFNIV